jgi:hypothetical protein
MLPSHWPQGIDVRGRFTRWKVRQCVPDLRGAIEKLAAESQSVECFDAAASGFIKQFAISGPRHPGRKALDRLARLYVRHYRRDLVDQHRYVEAAAKRALMPDNCLQ